MRSRLRALGWLCALAMTFASASCGDDGSDEDVKSDTTTDDVSAGCSDLMHHFGRCGFTDTMAEGEPQSQCVSNLGGFCTETDMVALVEYAECFADEALCEDGAMGVPDEEFFPVLLGDCSEPMEEMTSTCSTRVMDLAVMMMTAETE